MNIVETINMISRAVTAFGDLAMLVLIALIAIASRGEKVERQ
jgi:hypothetical protein